MTKITDVRTVLLTTPYGVEGAHTQRRSAAFVVHPTPSFAR
jgi:hypothetical protein